MRNLSEAIIERLRRSGDRIDVEGKTERPAPLGAEVVRLARLATSIHLAEAVERTVGLPGPATTGWIDVGDRREQSA